VKSRTIYLYPVNLPEINAWFVGMGVIVTGPTMQATVKAGAELIADDWRENAPYFEGWYQESIRVDINNKNVAQLGMGIPTGGVLASIYPHRVAGPAEEEQPYRYAGVLEFGGQLGPRQRNAYIPAQPSARPAWDSGAPKAQTLIIGMLRKLLVFL
jgi:hypothetical protein